VSRLSMLVAVWSAWTLAACSSSTNPAPRAPAANVAVGGVASASATWENNPSVGPDKVVDGSNYEDSVPANYWILPNRTAGWWQVDLGGEFLISAIEIYNTNNGISNDRGTQDFRIEILDSARKVVFSHAGILPFTSRSSAAHPIVPLTVNPGRTQAGRYVKVYVDSWYPTRSDTSWAHPVGPSGTVSNEGGGLNEVRVLGVRGD
jgi:F5/8 type C domain